MKDDNVSRVKAKMKNPLAWQAARAQYRHANRPQWRFPSLDSFLDTIPHIFAGGIPEVIARAKHGDTSLVPRALDMLNEFSSAIASEVSVPVMDVCGAYAIIPAFLSGQNECFRRNTFERVPNNTTPLKIFFCVARLTSEAKMLERGIATLALMLELSKTRTVELWTYNDGSSKVTFGDENHFNVAIKAQNPYCLSELCYVLASSEYAMTLAYGLEKYEIGNLGCTPLSALKQCLGASDNDLILHYKDADGYHEDLSAIDWIKHNLARHNEGIEKAELEPNTIINTVWSPDLTTFQ